MAQKALPKRTVEKKVQSYLRYLATNRRLPITQAYLFGSYAHGTPHAWSDIDLCIVSPQFRNSYTALASLWQWRRPEDTGIEPVGFDSRTFQKNLPLVAEIRRTGKKISWEEKR